jgi:hypothetical protein
MVRPAARDDVDHARPRHVEVGERSLEVRPPVYHHPEIVVASGVVHHHPHRRETTRAHPGTPVPDLGDGQPRRAHEAGQVTGVSPIDGRADVALEFGWKLGPEAANGSRADVHGPAGDVVAQVAGSLEEIDLPVSPVDGRADVALEFGWKLGPEAAECLYPGARSVQSRLEDRVRVNARPVLAPVPANLGLALPSNPHEIARSPIRPCLGCVWAFPDASPQSCSTDLSSKGGPSS